MAEVPAVPEGLVDVSQLKALDLPNVRLTGSYATGRAKVASDVDILIGLTDEEWTKVTPRTPPPVIERIYSVLPEEKVSPMLYRLSDVKDMWFFKRGRMGVSGAFVPINDAEMVQGLWNSSIGLKEIPSVVENPKPPTPEVPAVPEVTPRPLMAGQRRAMEKTLATIERLHKDVEAGDIITVSRKQVLSRGWQPNTGRVYTVGGGIVADRMVGLWGRFEGDRVRPIGPLRGTDADPWIYFTRAEKRYRTSLYTDPTMSGSEKLVTRLREPAVEPIPPAVEVAEDFEHTVIGRTPAGEANPHLMPENVPEEDFTTVTDVGSIYDLFSEGKISLRELDRLKDHYYKWYYSPERRTTVLRFYRQPDGTMTIYKQVYVQTYGESGNPKPQAAKSEVKLGGGNPIPEELDLARTLAIIDSRPKGRIIESKLREEFGDAVIDALRQGRYVVSGSAGYNPPLLVSLKGRELIQGGNPGKELISEEEAIGMLERLSMTPGEAARSLVADEAERREIMQTVQQRVKREQNKWAPMDPREGPPLPRIFAGLRWPWKR